MVMATPRFWSHQHWLSTALLPAAWIYRVAARCHRWVRGRRPYQAAIPVMCIGNVTLGGAGKTPTALAIGQLLLDKGYRVTFVSRGYGGTLCGPVLVDPTQHGAIDVGDEPLLLARLAPTIISRCRVSGIRMAEHSGAQMVILDDGLQNPSFVKDISLLVLDGKYGIGNGRIFPAGPLRQPLEEALTHCQGVIIIGDANASLPAIDKPLLRATIRPTRPTTKGPFIAFAGIAHPQKFFHTLTESNISVLEVSSFPDHYAYTDQDITALKNKATSSGATLITTEKDLVRLTPQQRAGIEVLPIRLEFESKDAVLRLLSERL